MKNFKLSILPVAAAITLVGCGGGDDSYTSFDEQKVTYDVENIVESFLGQNIDYVTRFKKGDSSAELVKYYDKNGNVVDFKFPTNTTAKFGCKADPLSLQNEKYRDYLRNPYFNIKPLTNGQKLVVMSSFPTEFTNKYLGDVSCRYSNYTFNKKYIIGKSSQKLIELKDDDKLIAPISFTKLSDLNRLYDVEHQTEVTSIDKKTIIKPYVTTVMNYADHEFIVNKDGEVKTYDIKNQQYVTLPNTKGVDWQFFSNDYMISKEYGGKAYIYDIVKKTRLSEQYIEVLENKGTDLKQSNNVTVSYGLFFNPAVDDYRPFKYVSKDNNQRTAVYIFFSNEWTFLTDTSDVKYSLAINSLKKASNLTPNANNAYLELNWRNSKYNYVASEKHTYNSGFVLAYESYKNFDQLFKIKDFPNNLVNAQNINDKVVVETAKDDIVEKERKFYFVDKNGKNIIGAANEKLISIEASASN